MCGIAGYNLSPGFTVPPEWSSVACEKLSHRGPDDHGIFEDQKQGVGLIHTRLSILDPSPLGHQPMYSSDSHVVLSFNGEIYNFRELRAELEISGTVFHGESDTEVLLALYLNLRENICKMPGRDSLTCLLQKINGIFSFALWDHDYQTLFLARDSFGIKPLYFQNSATGFFFASEIKALFRTSSQLDYSALERYLTFLWCPGGRTPDSCVSKLGPGEAMCVSQGRILNHFNWYQLPISTRRRPSGPALSPCQAIFGVEKHLRQAVHRQLVSDVPVGAFLSGGLDSSAVAALAREQKSDLRCFTIQVNGIGDEGFTDDLPYARRVASYLDLPLEIVQVDGSHMAKCLETMVWHLDEPLADPAPLNVLFISQLAREYGIKVLLSGVGGDDLFSGYRRHIALESERFWRWLPRRQRILLRDISALLPVANPLSRRLRKAFSGAHLDGDARLVHYFRWIERADLHALFTPAFRDALDQVQAEQPMIEFLTHLPSSTTDLERMLALEQRFFLSDHNLIYTDKMSMAAGIEVRVPFLDLDLVQYAARVQNRFKLRHQKTKWVLKKAMEPYLPHDVIYRPKSGFGAPLRRWLRVELRDWLSDILSFQRLQKRGLFDPQAVHQLIEANAQGRIDASHTLFSLACIEVWCKFFIDQESFPSSFP